MPIRRLAALCCLALAAACSDKNSSSGGEGGMPIPTSAMHITARVDAQDGSSANVSVTLDDGRLLLATTTYTLTGGDALRACVLGSCKPLTRSSILGELLADSYKNTFPFVADVEYSVQLTRTAGAPASSSVTLPPLFDITMPARGTQFTDGDIFTVAWWPPGTGAHVDARASTSCTHTDGEKTLMPGVSPGDPDGDGRADISVDELLRHLDFFRRTSAPVRDCEIQVEVQHSRSGTIDSVFAGGAIRGSQTRSLSLTYVPSR
jgi:hypothetical protein